VRTTAIRFRRPRFPATVISHMRHALPRRALLGTLALLLFVGSIGLGASSRFAQATALATNGDWPLFGNNSDNERFSNLTQINAGNVRQLGIAWTQAEGEQLTMFETAPVVINGVLYYSTNTDQVRAVNGATGKLMWQYTPTVNFYQAITGGGAGAPTSRGVTVAKGRVYLLTFDDHLIALRATTGKRLWDTAVADANVGYSETSPPTHWDGLLFVGAAAADSGERGFVAAYDATTGKQVWRFWVVPAPGQGWVPKTPLVSGGDVWMPSTIDTTTGILYFGTGNPYPDDDNSHRPGCNPWVDSTVALQARTGRFIWAHTEVCPDLWDYDSMPTPMIFTVVTRGKAIHAVGHANKDGQYFVYNAATGKILAQSGFATRYSHPTLPLTEADELCPGPLGGFEYSPAAYSPLTHAVYNPALTACLIGPQEYPSPETSGTMAAIDVNTGKFLWRTQVPALMVGGAVATASNLVFSGSTDGHFYAFDAVTGKVEWQADLSLSSSGPPITYAISGTQYIAVAVGGFEPEAELGHANLGGQLVVFKLHGAPISKLPISSGTLDSGLSEVVSLKGYTQLGPSVYEKKGNSSTAAVFKVVAAATSANNGFNFNSYAKGHADFIVPAGWAVGFIFTNKQNLAHSLGITTTLRLGSNTVPLATTPNPSVGLVGKTTQYTGVPYLLPGKYYLVCLIAGHAVAGMWDRLTVSSSVTAPSIQVTK
jgi:alcohol dehydrogenase (cytochrome c)